MKRSSVNNNKREFLILISKLVNRGFLWMEDLQSQFDIAEKMFVFMYLTRFTYNISNYENVLYRIP